VPFNPRGVRELAASVDFPEPGPGGHRQAVQVRAPGQRVGRPDESRRPGPPGSLRDKLDAGASYSVGAGLNALVDAVLAEQPEQPERREMRGSSGGGARKVSLSGQGAGSGR
jgi:hypothetical protein